MFTVQAALEIIFDFNSEMDLSYILILMIDFDPDDGIAFPVSTSQTFMSWNGEREGLHQQIILEMTNREGSHVLEEKWKEMNKAHLYACLRILILAGVYKGGRPAVLLMM